MSIQLTKLAILDKESGKQFLSKDGKTRQVYKEKPLKTKVDAGQMVVDGYDYSVSISGVLSKTDKEFLSKLASSDAYVLISGYTESKMILSGSGKVKGDDGSFIISCKSSIVYDEQGRMKSPMTLEKSLHFGGSEWPEVYFPFPVELTASFTIKSGGEMSMNANDEKGETIVEVLKEYAPLGRHAFKDRKSITMQLPEGVCYVSVVRESIIAENLSLTIK